MQIARATAGGSTPLGLATAREPHVPLGGRASARSAFATPLSMRAHLGAPLPRPFDALPAGGAPLGVQPASNLYRWLKKPRSADVGFQRRIARFSAIARSASAANEPVRPSALHRLRRDRSREDRPKAARQSSPSGPALCACSRNVEPHRSQVEAAVDPHWAASLSAATGDKDTRPAATAISVWSLQRQVATVESPRQRLRNGIAGTGAFVAIERNERRLTVSGSARCAPHQRSPSPASEATSSAAEAPAPEASADAPTRCGKAAPTGRSIARMLARTPPRPRRRMRDVACERGPPMRDFRMFSRRGRRRERDIRLRIAGCRYSEIDPPALIAS